MIPFHLLNVSSTTHKLPGYKPNAKKAATVFKAIRRAMLMTGLLLTLLHHSTLCLLFKSLFRINEISEFIPVT